MTDHVQADATAEVRESWFVRTAGRIGDLGSPFYDQEHQRDVWNEASAVGFQLMLWLLPVAAVVSVWVGGAPAVPYALVMLFAPGLASWVVIGFAQARGADLGAAEGYTMLRWRVLAQLVLFGAFCAGVVRAAPEGPISPATAWGMLVGAAIGIALLTWGQQRARRVSS